MCAREHLTLRRRPARQVTGTPPRIEIAAADSARERERRVRRIPPAVNSFSNTTHDRRSVFVNVHVTCSPALRRTVADLDGRLPCCLRHRTRGRTVRRLVQGRSRNRVGPWRQPRTLKRVQTQTLPMRCDPVAPIRHERERGRITHRHRRLADRDRTPLIHVHEVALDILTGRQRHMHRAHRR